MPRINPSLLDKLDDLLKRDAAGEDVAAELKACGEQIGWKEEKAHHKNGSKRRYTRYSKESLELCKKNGINRQTFWGRMTHYGWEEKDACRVPAGMSREDYYERLGMK